MSCTKSRGSTFYSGIHGFSEEGQMQSGYLGLASAPGTAATVPAQPFLPSRAPSASEGDLAVECILADCFFSVGQAVGDRKTAEHTAVIWWHDRYRAKFLRAMHSFGNTWPTDRDRVTAMCRMLGKSAVDYAGEQPAIDLGAAMKAAADVEKFCVRHAERRRRRLGRPVDVDDVTMYAGYWCAL